MSRKNRIVANNLFSFLVRVAPNRVFASILLGIFAGVLYSLIVPLILAALQASGLETVSGEKYYIGDIEVIKPRMALFFLLLCAVILICRTASVAALQRAGVDASRKLRIYLYERISRMPTANLELVGPSKLLAVLTTDVPRIISGSSLFPVIVINISTCLGLLGFLVYLDFRVFLFIISTILFGMITYQIPMIISQKFNMKAREAFDGIQEGIRGLIYGSKELKVNSKRREDFLGRELIDHEDKLRDHQKRSVVLMVAARTYGDLITFFSVGIVTFLAASFYGLPLETTVGIAMVLFYISAPIGNILNALPSIMQANVSLKKMSYLLDKMPEEKSSAAGIPMSKFGEVALEGITHRYEKVPGVEQSFHLGPVDLTLRPGEVTFLVGPNGSGKTTLGKIISMHYMPSSGSMKIDGVGINDDNRASYRESVSCVYSDYYLFRKIFGISGDEVQLQADHYLDVLGLSNKVSLKGNEFSTVSLSAGQRKRLALLVAYLDNRSIYIFDEWAADQDPAYKRIFYHDLLPGFRELGKIVIVITHDDQYYSVADKVVEMREGGIVRVLCKGAAGNEFAPPPQVAEVEHSGDVSRKHIYSKDEVES